jgi:hypothetical protein
LGLTDVRAVSTFGALPDINEITGDAMGTRQTAMGELTGISIQSLAGRASL